MTSQHQRDELKKELCDILVRTGALKFGMFTLEDNKLSPYYVDLRVIPSFPEAFAKVEKLYVEVSTKDLNLKDVDRIAGIPTAGIPFAVILASSLKKPFLYVRREAARGRGRKVEGILNPGDVVLLVDDLIATGGTMLKATNAIRSEGGLVKDVLTLVDRQEGGRAALENQEVKLHNLILISEAAEILHGLGAIDKEQLNVILKQILS